MSTDITAQPAESFGAAVRALRLDRGMSQASLGRAMGAYSMLVERLERAESRPRRDLIARIAEALDLSPAELAWLQASLIASKHTIADWEAMQESVIARAQAGDHAAFELITSQFGGPIRSLLYRLMGNSLEWVDDLYQQTILKAWLNIGRFTFEGAKGLLNWLLKIANNLALDVLRRDQRLRMIPDACLPDSVRDWWWNGLEAHERGPESITTGRETIAQVRAVMARISERHRVALALRNYDGLDCQKIGIRMAEYNTHQPGEPMTRAAIKSVLFRAREDFKRTWLEMYGEVMVA